ncbi:alpha/beta fold hydrolase [Subtercola sp. YIM 133946]|uniref:alpha/beta fold hydrolase n=1 Tax=Subtercola sp. YIM 133946 TaxID=3118909 RepID=UPI002F92A506
MGSWVLVHGTPLAPAIWQPAAALLAGDVFVPDCRAVPPGPNPQAALAAQVVAQADDGRFDLAGHSFGGQIALEIALLVPERVRSLTILCSRDTPFPAFQAVAEAVRGGAAPSVDATLARWLSPNELTSGAAVVDDVRAELAAASLPDWARALEAIATYDRSAATPSLAMPVRLVACGQDAVATPEAMGELHARIPHSRLDVRPNAHHLSLFLDPAALAHTLEGA